MLENVTCNLKREYIKCLSKKKKRKQGWEMSKKIVFLDIDGTILDHEKKIPESTKLAVKKLRENGVQVAIATGRSPLHAKIVIDELEIDCFVSFNGAYAVYDGKVVHETPFKKEHIEEIIEFANENGHSLCFLGAEGEGFTAINEHTRKALKSVLMEISGVDEDYYKENNIYQVIAFHDGADVEHYRENVTSVDFVPWHENAFDILPKNKSKASGIQAMIKNLGFNIEDVYAFGDGLNDIEMLKTVGTGIAMGNAEDAVKIHADFVTKDVAEGGIYHGLKHFNLI